MRIPPTRVSHHVPAVGNYTSNTTPKTLTLDALADDLLVLFSSAESADATMSTPTSDGTIAWTPRIALAPTPTGDWSRVMCWTGAVGATATGITLSVVRGGTALFWGFSCTVWRDHGGVGVVGSTNTASPAAPSLALAGCSENSAVQCAINDWAAADGTSRTWRTINGSAMTESTYSRSSANHAVYGGYSPDIGAGGSVTVGLTAPATMKPSIGGIEILGLAIQDEGTKNASALQAMTGRF